MTVMRGACSLDLGAGNGPCSLPWESGVPLPSCLHTNEVENMSKDRELHLLGLYAGLFEMCRSDERRLTGDRPTPAVPGKLKEIRKRRKAHRRMVTRSRKINRRR